MNLPINFDMTEDEIRKSGEDLIDTEKYWLKSDNLSFDSYIHRLSQFDYVFGVINFLKYVSPDNKIRDASEKYEITLKKYYIDFYRSKDNYKIFKEMKSKNLCEKKILKNILKNFEDNGVHLDNDKIFQDLHKKLLVYENKFSKNIIDGVKKIKFKKDDLEGIDNSELKKHIFDKSNNIYIFTTDYPDVSLILKECSVESTRRAIYK